MIQIDDDLGLVDKDFKEESESQLQYQLKIADNVRLIRDVIRDLRPDHLVVEMCDDRYEKWLADVLSHP